MPWCEDCEKYYAPSALTPEGHCPRCDADLEPAEPSVRRAPDDVAADDDDEGVPWHFKLMVVLLVVYLGWRFYQLITGQL